MQTGVEQCFPIAHHIHFVSFKCTNVPSLTKFITSAVPPPPHPTCTQYLNVKFRKGEEKEAKEGGINVFTKYDISHAEGVRQYDE